MHGAIPLRNNLSGKLYFVNLRKLLKSYKSLLLYPGIGIQMVLYFEHTKIKYNTSGKLKIFYIM